MSLINIAKIVHPTDLTEDSRQAAEYALFLTQQFDAELHVLFVLEGAMDKIPASGEGFPPPGECREVMSDMAVDLLSTGVGITAPAAMRVTLATRLGPLTEQIIAYAEQNDASLIVMGTHGRSGLAHVVVGSVAEAVVRKATCPVLTVRTRPRQP